MLEENNSSHETFSQDPLRVILPAEDLAHKYPPENTPAGNEKTENAGAFFLEIFKFTIVAILVVAPIRFFIAQPFIVKGESMNPTFMDGQYLIIDELTYRTHEPERGDVIVFKYPKDPSKYFIKRIIGLPNETMRIDAGKITIFNKQHPEGLSLNEPYLKNMSYETAMETIGDNEYFAMGDNRSNSLDSRVWGSLSKENIVGRVVVRLFPLHAVGLFPGKYSDTI